MSSLQKEKNLKKRIEEINKRLEKCKKLQSDPLITPRQDLKDVSADIEFLLKLITRLQQRLDKIENELF